MTDLLTNPVFWIVMTAVSEIIGMNKKLKDNSIVELILHAVMALAKVAIRDSTTIRSLSAAVTWPLKTPFTRSFRATGSTVTPSSS